MGFLDNSGDIILDAVLTDAGRKRLSRGDGTFKVTKYAFGDDEIDYGKYNPNAASGSAYFDLEILQTPILEAFTNNRSSLKSKLMSLTNNNLLYLPQITLNQNTNLDNVQRPATNVLGSGSFYVAVNGAAAEALTGSAAAINGSTTQQTSQGHYIRVDQGLLTNRISSDANLSPELTEQQYMIELDNRLGQVVDIAPFPGVGGTTGLASPAFIDDDQIATYYVTQGVGGFIANCVPGALTIAGGAAGENGAAENPGYEVIEGPRGTKLAFAIFAKDSLRQSDYLFDTIGEEKDDPFGTAATDVYKTISTTVRVTGVTTGYQIDIPVVFAKKTA